ncbi:IclR family transcriptional regulator domain-containing protein [Georgenia muralis]|uniref:IclR family transcriptional regulator n=1 Tax=Georgenia muralis TaxID=154117 RepID=A0A3N4Z856_9MICO|nr:IclR family transcriptional regulator C-terminal domain-containing protein [Georgenia muralis]RPF28174.1 IclR family transcriptional regulator [Georgenia muralis]
MDPVAPASEGLQSLARGLAVIETLAAADEPMTLARVAQSAGLNRAVTRRVLLTLVDVGYVLAHGRDFTLRPRVLELGEAYRASLRLPAIAVGPMQDLTRSTGRSSALGVLDGADVVHVERVAAGRIVDAVPDIGTRLPARTSALGRVLLAALPKGALRDVLRGGVAAPLAEDDELVATLAGVRAQGHCVVAEELQRGLTSVAAPVRDATGRVVAAVDLALTTVTLPDGRVPEDDVAAVRAAAEAISAAAAGL